MLKIGLTGGIGSGKSTVANLFRLNGVDVIDADKISREAVRPGSQTLERIVNHFGTAILNKDKTLNRSALRTIVFKNPNELEWLNQCLHPQIRQQILTQIESVTSRYVILDIPLLFENKLEYLVDRILVVDIPEQMQIERVCMRDDSTPQLVESIMSQQVNREYRLANADDVLDNIGSLEQLKKNVYELHQKYSMIAENV